MTSTFSRQAALALWVLTGALSLLMLAPENAAVFGYQRELVDAGEIWRVVTGGFVHLGAMHLLLNGCAMALLLFVFKKGGDLQTWGVFFLLNAGVFLGEHLLGTHGWAKGSSGAVYGLVVYLGLMNPCGRVNGWVLASVAVLVTVLQSAGLLTTSSELIGGQVLWEHHAYGVFLGTVMAALTAASSLAAAELLAASESLKK